MDRIYWSTGQFVLGAYAGTVVVAVFAVAIQLEHMYMSFSTAISGVFLPKVTAMAVHNSDGSAISDLFIRMGRVQYCVMVLVLTGFFLFGQQFILLWAGKGYEDAYFIAMLFFIPLTIPLIQNLGITILQARGQMKFRSLLYLIISLISFIAQIPLSKYYGGIGCACAIAGALILGHVIIMNVYYQFYQQINIIRFWIEIAKMSVIPIFVTVVSYFILQNFVLDSFTKLIVGIVSYLTVYLPLFFVFSMNAYERELILNPIKKILRRV
jgi:O-antigen/teichoic acid export membrane protein